MTLAGSRNVLIHVFDEHRKMTKDFTCRREVLLEKMSYFRAYLNQGNELDDIDISVHCDVEIFEWLVEYMEQQESEWKARISLNNVTSILVSSEFLQMDVLVDECVAFISGRIQDFVQLRVDFGCLSENTVSKIAARCSSELLQQLHDPKDKMLSKLLRKKLQSFFQDLHKRGTEICSCVSCGILYLRVDEKRLHCARGKRRLGLRGELIALHRAASSWTPEEWMRGIVQDRGSSWSAVYWVVWASLRVHYCSSCKRYCSFLEHNKCAFHPGPVIGLGVEARFGCCGVRIFLGGDLDDNGCRTRDHTLSPREPESTARCLNLLKANWNLVASILELEPGCEPESSAPSMEMVEMASISQTLDADTNLNRTMVPLPSDTISSIRRQQWVTLNLQEQDRVRVQSTTRQLAEFRT